MGEAVSLVDSGGASAEAILKQLEETGHRAEKNRKGTTRIFCSANRENYLTIAQAVLNRDISGELEQL